MKTDIHPLYHELPKIDQAESILRNCVHCGFCTATCPTYQVLGDERDSPRGRIYLIKQMLETGKVTEASQTHLDRCLTCRSCETTCPSGVEYGKLLDISRDIMDKQLPRNFKQRLLRTALRQVLPYPNRFGPLLKLGQLSRPLLPPVLKAKVPATAATRVTPKASPTTTGLNRKMLVLAGCAQSVATPNTNQAAARVLAKLGIELITAPKAGCCGAVSYHLGAHDEGLDFMRRNIDAWWPYVEQGVEAIISSASGCGVMIHEYAELLAHDSDYADKAAKISALAKDLTQVIEAEPLETLNIKVDEKLAVHCPCTLQHGLGLSGSVERIMLRLGARLARTEDGHLCCGSAGTYSITQPTLSQTLKAKKLKALTVDDPEKIVTANVGCQLHLSDNQQAPVSHWIELLDQ